jgi:serine/threonine-protein kinase
MPHAEPSAPAIREQLERVLASPGFARNERLSRFLRFVVEGTLEGRSAELKESVLAIEVFGRKPVLIKQDSIVRTEATRLRARLAEYYGDGGRSDPLIIELPKGGYAPRFHDAQANHTEVVASPAARPLRYWTMAVAAALTAVVAGAVWWRVARPAPFVIAVLPLTSLSQDHANDYIADGLTDEIIRNLSLIEGLAVRSRLSSLAFHGKPRDVREIGAQLDAGYILDGSVFRDGSRLRVNVELVRVRDNVPLWSGRFDREASDIFSIQDEISRQLVNNLRLKLGRGRRRYETSLEAYELYLRALPHTTIGATQNHYQQAAALYNQVISRDPAFAPAYAGLAASYSAMLFEFLVDPSRDSRQIEVSMRKAAEKAIELDPLLPEAHDAMGLNYARQRQWAESEKSFRRSLELDPNRPATYAHLAVTLLLPLDRTDEALRQLRRAQQADPLSAPVRHTYALALLCAGRYGEAAAQCERALAIDPEYFRARQHLARARALEGRTAEAIHILENMRVKNSGYLGFAYARAGRRSDAEKLAASEAGRPQRELFIYAGLGDRDRAFDALERLAASADGRAFLYLGYPELAGLRSDPRMMTIRRRLGLPR